MTGLPRGLTFDAAGPYVGADSTERGVYQKLSTRADGEIIATGDY